MKKTSKTMLTVSLFSLFITFSPVIAENISNDELIASAMAVAEGRANPRQQAIAFSCNDRLNNLALTGKISNSVYQTNQKVFVEKNDELIRRAAARSGLQVAPPKKQASDYKPGTDTDRQLLGSGQELTVQNVKDARNNYNQAVAGYLKEAGLKADSGANWAARLTTDIMPSPHQMKPDAFREATSYINAKGGLAYSDPEAARLQLDIDAGNNRSLTAVEAAAYHNEMQHKINDMNNEIRRLQQQKAGVSDPAALDNIDAEIRKHTAFMSKYVSRDNEVADLLIKETEAFTERRKAGRDNRADPGLNEGDYESNSSRLIADSQRRNASKQAIRGEAAVGAMNEQLAVKATRRVNDAIAGLASAGDNNTRAGAIIAANLKKLPAAGQAQAIADLEVKYGSEMAKSVAGELKKQQTNSAGSRPGDDISLSRKQSVCTGLGLVNTALNVRNQYAEGKSTTEILWNMSFAGDLETVSRETSDYTSREIERLRQKYRAAGEDPESTSTKLKILAEASFKGTIHGSLTGGYELLKSASKGVAGAALTAGESTIFLVGEALDTGNVLDQALAEMKAQNMEQSVQNARAARFGRQAVSELKRLAGEADYLKSVLEQNARSARLFCRDADARLDELASLMRQSSEAGEMAKTANLPELEKELLKKIAAADREIAGLSQQAEVALRTLQGDEPGVAEKTARALRGAADQQRSQLESVGTELEKMLGIVAGPDDKMLRETAGVISARLIEQSETAKTNAELMRKNEAQYKKVLTAFDSLKNRVEEAESFFADKRQANEGDWMVVKSDIRQIARPDDRMPEAFFAEVGTLERLPEKIKSDLARLKIPAGSAEAVAESQPENEERAVRLASSLQAATDALSRLYAAIKKIEAAASPPPKQASDVRINAPQNAFVGDSVQFRADLPAAVSVSLSVGASVRSAVSFDPYDGHDPESPEGMLALQAYKRAYESGRVEDYVAEKTGQQAPGANGPVIEWFFDDNSGAGNNRGNPISHVYANPGIYNVLVRVYAANNSTPLAVGKTVINITARDPQAKAPPPSQPGGEKLLPCGHRPGECPSPKPLKCSLHSGAISNR